MIGQTISHYRITAQLGEGGMGIVYRADDLKLDRQVAIKVLPPRLSQHPEARVRMLREAKAASALQHPNICTVHEIDDTEDGQLFMVMPCYEGETLRQRLDHGPMSVDEALEIGRQISSALAATHAKGIVHRDLKPGNIMLTNGGKQAVLMDFGLARPDEATQLTKTGTTVGTIAYMSPEQVRGERADERSDLWSLGVVLYEMTTGRRPFEGDGEVPVLESILHKDPEPASSVNEELSPAFAAMLDRLLTKDPTKRSADASTIHRQIEQHRRALEDSGPGPDAPLSWKWKHWSRRHRAALRVAVSAVLTVAALLTWQMWPASGPMIQSLAVLPFTDLSEGKDRDWLCDGMTETLIQSLGEAGVPGVFASRAMMRFKDSSLGLDEIAQQLGADAFVESSVIELEDRIRINARLILGDTKEQIWAESFERGVSEVLQLHADITRTIAERIQVALDPSAEKRLASQRTVDPEAFQQYLRGKHWFNALELDKAKEAFEKAIAIDPVCAEAWAGLAAYYAQIIHVPDPAPDILPSANAALEKALEIDPDLQMGYAVRAHLAWEHEWDQPKARQAIARAIELNPSDSYTRVVDAWQHLVCRRFDEAADAASLACRLDPFDQLAKWTEWAPLLFAQRFDDALASLERRAAADSAWARSFDHGSLLAQVHYYAGNKDRAYAIADSLPLESIWLQTLMGLVLDDRMEEAREMYSRVMTDLDDSQRRPFDVFTAQWWLGDFEGAEKTLELFHPLPAGMKMSTALFYYVSGREEECFELLEELYDSRFSWLTRIYMMQYHYEFMHEDPRYMDLVRRMGLAS